MLNGPYASIIDLPHIPNVHIPCNIGLSNPPILANDESICIGFKSLLLALNSSAWLSVVLLIITLSGCLLITRVSTSVLTPIDGIFADWIPCLTEQLRIKRVISPCTI
eukprot:NODE_24_length_36516_cov_0.652470.p21 type:complete len:108 gc:universal NODE_24_length_36516_cov_0.652470:20139-20462(+)